MAQRIITPQGWLFIPGVYKMLTATDVLGRAIDKAAEFTGMDRHRSNIAMTLESPNSVLDFINAVKDLREIQYQLRIEAQALDIHLPMSHIYEEGMYNIDPHTPQVNKLERMVKGLQQSTADMVDGIEAPLKLRNFKL
jgi:hypothetical protein